MRTVFFNIITVLTASVLALSCAGKAHKVTLSGAAVYEPQYAQGFSIFGTDGESTVIEIRNPWQGAQGVTSQLFVSRGGELPPEGFVGTTVNAPVQRVVCFSSTHIAFMDALESIDKVKGVSGAQYISCPKVIENFAENKIRDVGYDSNVNYEVLSSLKPDIVFIYGVAGENTSVTDKLRELRIPYVYIGDYIEEQPLGKAEWIVPFGEMLDCRDKAEEILGGIAERYEKLKQEAVGFTQRPKVMLNSPYRDVWFVPGDRSYIVTLVRDAGGDYLFAGKDDAVSRPMSGEAAYMAAKDADVWLNPNQAQSIAELKAQNPKFVNIKCVDSGRVYNCTKRQTKAGGSDFWESGALYADRVLRDMIMCIHPDWGGSCMRTEDSVCKDCDAKNAGKSAKICCAGCVESCKETTEGGNCASLSEACAESKCDQAAGCAEECAEGMYYFMRLE